VGFFNPDENILSIEGRLTRVFDSNYYIDIKYEAESFLQKPPVSSIIAKEINECQASKQAFVLLDGSNSQYRDMDGGSLEHLWYLENDQLEILDEILTGSSGMVSFPLGRHLVSQTVFGPREFASTSHMYIEVVDTIPPVIETLEKLSITSCNEAESMNLTPPVATDTCSEVTIAGYIISHNNVEIDPIEIVNNNVTLIPGKYIVKWIATDESGNNSYSLQEINIFSAVRTTNSLTLRDYSSIESAVFNSGTGVVEIGAHANVEGIITSGTVNLRSHSFIDGNVVAKGNIIKQNDVIITGTEKTNEDFNFANLEQDDLSGIIFSNNDNDIHINSGTSMSFSQGHYPRVTLNSFSELILGDGDYYFKGLNVNSNAKIILTGTARIFVQENLFINEPFIDANDDIATVYLGYAGQNQITVNSAFSGELIAPRARVVLGQSNSPTEYNGRFVARDLEVARSAIIVCN
jgi:hypothetical protein